MQAADLHLLDSIAEYQQRMAAGPVEPCMCGCFPALPEAGLTAHTLRIGMPHTAQLPHSLMSPGGSDGL